MILFRYLTQNFEQADDGNTCHYGGEVTLEVHEDGKLMKVIVYQVSGNDRSGLNFKGGEDPLDLIKAHLVNLFGEDPCPDQESQYALIDELGVFMDDEGFLPNYGWLDYLFQSESWELEVDPSYHDRYDGPVITIRELK